MSGTPASGQPASEIAARGYTWPPFEPGNTKALHHGARSERTLSAIAQHLYETARNSPDWPPYLNEPVYQPAVRSYFRGEAILTALETYLDGINIAQALTEITTLDETTDTEGDKTAGRAKRISTARRTGAALEYLRKWETTTSNLRARLGLDPLSRAKLGKDIAAARLDLAQYWADQDAADTPNATTAA